MEKLPEKLQKLANIVTITLKVAEFLSPTSDFMKPTQTKLLNAITDLQKLKKKKEASYACSVIQEVRKKEKEFGFVLFEAMEEMREEVCQEEKGEWP